MKEFCKFIFGFFRGWRRKFGILTLIVACLCMAGWVRSLHNFEVCTLSPNKRLHLVFLSFNQRWRLQLYREQLPSIKIDSENKDRSCQSVVGIGDGGFFEFRVLNEFYCEDAEVFEISEYRDKNDSTIISLYPYWSVVVPLTLLSAYLLLGNPRSKDLPLPITEGVA